MSFSSAPVLTTAKFLNDQEVYLFEKNISAVKNRDTLMLFLLHKYGMRQGELLGCKHNDLNIASKTLFVRGTKNSRDREFPLSHDIFVRLMDAKSQSLNDPERRLFPMCKMTLFRIWNKYRPVKKPLHSLRHTAAISIYKKTKDIQIVQKVLGHRDINNTLIYQQFCYSQEELRKVFNV